MLFGVRVCILFGFQGLLIYGLLHYMEQGIYGFRDEGLYGYKGRFRQTRLLATRRYRSRDYGERKEEKESCSVSSAFIAELTRGSVAVVVGR